MNQLIKRTLIFIGCLLVIDAVILFAYAKFNFGTIIPFFIGVIFLVHAYKWQWVRKLFFRTTWLKKIWQGLWTLFFVWLTSFLIFVGVLIYKIPNNTEVNDIKALIVLGSGVNGDTPTPTLANRLDTAVPVIKNNPELIPIVAGGVGFAREHSEAHVMANYLTNIHSIPYKRIQQENKSTSTEENLLFSEPILKHHQINKTNKIAIVTSDFHTIRAKAIANKIGYNNVTIIASPTPKSIIFNAWFREYFAWISGWLLGEY